MILMYFSMVNFYYHAFSLTGLKIKIEIILLVTFIFKEICCAGKNIFMISNLLSGCINFHWNLGCPVGGQNNMTPSFGGSFTSYSFLY